MKDFTINFYNGRTTRKGFVVLTATELTDILEEVETLKRQNNYTKEWLDILRDELELSEKNHNYLLAAKISAKTLEDKLSVIDDKIEKIKSKLK